MLPCAWGEGTGCLFLFGWIFGTAVNCFETLGVSARCPQAVAKQAHRIIPYMKRKIATAG